MKYNTLLPQTTLFIALVCLAVLASSCDCGNNKNSPESGQHMDGGGVADKSASESTKSWPDSTVENIGMDSPPSESPNESPIADAGAQDQPPQEASIETSQPLTPEEICPRIANLRCKHIMACCGGVGLRFASQQACTRALTDDCEKNTFVEELRGVTQGHIALSSENMQMCEAALQQESSCSALAPEQLKKVCRKVFDDKALSVGDTCKSQRGGLSCAAHMGQCVSSFLGGGEVVCARLAAEGEDCRNTPCQEGLHCPLHPGDTKECRAPLEQEKRCVSDHECRAGLACIEQRCTSPHKEGETCQTHRQCQPGFACHPTEEICVKAQENKSTCAFSGHCVDGLFCHQQRLQGSLCLAASKEGAFCQQTEDCLTPGLFYCHKQVCTKRPALNASCTSESGCQAPYQCDATTSTCQSLPTDGDHCRQASPACALGLTCLQESGTPRCRPLKTLQQACAVDEECAAGLYCKSKQCASLPSARETCYIGSCASGHYCEATSNTCKVHASTGGDCPIGNECPTTLACLPDTNGLRKCTTLPKQGERCRQRCQAGLLCRPSPLAGTCKPSLCQGFLLTP